MKKAFFAFLSILFIFSITGCTWLAREAEEGFFDGDFLSACKLYGMPMPDSDDVKHDGNSVYCNMNDEERIGYADEVASFLIAKDDIYYKGYYSETGNPGGIFYIPEYRFAPLTANASHGGWFAFSLTEKLNEGNESNHSYANGISVSIAWKEGKIGSYSYNTVIKIDNDPDFFVYQEPEHMHTYQGYQDEFGHGLSYTCGCETPPSLTPHLDGDKNGACDDCGYVLKKAPSQGLEFTKNQNGENFAVKSIGTCTDSEIVIPETHEGLPVVGILPEAFAKNTSITSVTVPDSVILIYENAFMNCTALEILTLGDGLKGIWESAFIGCSALQEIVFPDGLEYIYEHAFNGCASLKEIDIPDSVTKIGAWAFANCPSLEAISFSDGLQVIENSTCYACTSLSSIDFGSGVTQVKPDAFYGCVSLQRLYIPENVVALLRAFPYCSGLTHVEFEATDGWKWASKNGFFNGKTVTNPETNASHMRGTWNESSWKREPEGE